MVRSLALERLVERMAADLDDTGWCVLDAALPATLVAELSLACTARRDFVPAGTGRHQTYQHDATVRSDAICWFDAGIAVDARYLDVMEQLRGALNLRLFLGLFDYECHYARYAPGACYRRHVDAFAGERNRVLSTVLYLNRGWRNEEGGELLLYGPGMKLSQPYCRNSTGSCCSSASAFRTK